MLHFQSLSVCHSGQFLQRLCQPHRPKIDVDSDDERAESESDMQDAKYTAENMKTGGCDYLIECFGDRQ